MKQSFQIFYWGMMISFLGSLPPGVTNIAGTEISSSKGTGEALLYIMGFMVAEAIMVRITLSGMNWLTRSKRFFHLLEWATAGMLVVFSIACFFASNSAQQSAIGLPGFMLSSFMTGVIISLINPMHIPFWLGWSTFLLNKGILTPDSKKYNVYIAGIATGTLAGFVIFIFGGQYLLKVFQSNQYLINCVIGFAFFITALLHIRKMIFVPVAVRHARLFRRS
jgi:threonine/homoserine/homoserine lactone efflux protein